jgi:uncharacterized protein (DUF1778 family)
VLETAPAQNPAYTGRPHFHFPAHSVIAKMCGLCKMYGMERLVLEITPQQRRQIKTLAAFNGMTMKDYILGKTLPASKTPRSVKRHAQATEDDTKHLLSSPRMAARLTKAMKGTSAKRVSFDNLKEVKHALGI